MLKSYPVPSIPTPMTLSLNSMMSTPQRSLRLIGETDSGELRSDTRSVFEGEYRVSSHSGDWSRIRYVCSPGNDRRKGTVLASARQSEVLMTLPTPSRSVLVMLLSLSITSPEWKAPGQGSPRYGRRRRQQRTHGSRYGHLPAGRPRVSYPEGHQGDTSCGPDRRDKNRSYPVSDKPLIC